MPDAGLLPLPTLWRSPLGRRFALLLLGAALVPLLLFAWLANSQVSAELRRQNEHALHDAAKTAGMGIAARLAQLTQDLELAALVVSERGLPPVGELSLLARLRQRCLALGRQRDGQVQVLFGAPPTLPAELAVAGRLSLHSVPGSRRLFGCHAAPVAGGPDCVLVVELDLAWLCDPDELRAHGAEVAVYEGGGQLLVQTTGELPPAAVLAQHLAAAPASGSVAFRSAGEDQLARYWRVFLRPQYGIDLLVLQTRPVAVALRAVHGFERWFVLTSIATLLAVALLSLAQLRRLLWPIHALAAATRRIAAGNYDEPVGLRTADELGQLGAAFDRMAGRLREQVASRERVERDLAASRDAALAAARAKAEFITNVSHELRTPMAEILGATEILVGLGDGDAAARLEFAGIAHRGAERLRELVEDVLDLDAQSAWELEPVDLAATLQEAVQRLPGSQQRRIRLEVAAQLPAVQGVAVRLVDTWRRLLDNAAKFSPNDSEVVLRAAAAADAVVVEVEDHGVGISRLDLVRIFEPFQQAGRDQLTDKAAGTGLGLAIVQRTVERLSGSIEVDSELGNGAIFRVRLPVAVPAVPAAGELLTAR
jgi:signal transduction histidine kinase